MNKLETWLEGQRKLIADADWSPLLSAHEDAIAVIEKLKAAAQACCDDKDLRYEDYLGNLDKLQAVLAIDPEKL